MGSIAREWSYSGSELSTETPDIIVHNFILLNKLPHCQEVQFKSARQRRLWKTSAGFHWLQLRKLKVSLSSVHSLNQSGRRPCPYTSVSLLSQPISGQPLPAHTVSSFLGQWSYVKFYYIKSDLTASAGRRRASHRWVNNTSVLKSTLIK